MNVTCQEATKNAQLNVDLKSTKIGKHVNNLIIFQNIIFVKFFLMNAQA